jgi:acyl-CoA thioesterase YciA
MESSAPREAMAPRPSSASRVSLSIIIMPGQVNPFGTLHGGVLLRLADECGAIAALRHVGHGQITTAAMDSMTFLGPVFVGERVELIAEVTHVGRTSIESRIEVFAEPPERAERRIVAVGYALYVALDEQEKRPQPAPPLLSESEADRRRDDAGRARQAVRLARRSEAQAEAHRNTAAAGP